MVKAGPEAAASLTTAVAAVGVSIGVAAVAGLAAGALTGAGLLTVSGATTGGRRGSKPPLKATDVKWDEEGRLENWQYVLKAVQQGGLEPAARADIWPLLLDVFPPSSTAQERDAELERLRRLYTKLVLVCQELDNQVAALRSTSSQSSRSTNTAAAEHSVCNQGPAEQQHISGGSSPERGAPVPPLPGNLAAFSEAHRIIVMDAVRTDIQKQQQGGPIGGGAPSPTITILPVAVGDGLPELMLVNPPEPEAEHSPAAAVAAGQVPVWRSALAGDTLGSASHLNEHSRRQMLRLVNLLSAYAVHDPETGYCQGMSDIAAIFVQLFEDDSLAFACFERLMRSARRNFKHDETGIKHQLGQIARILRDTDPALHRKLLALEAGDCMFAYRMVVVMLRRELPPNECCTLWEIQWALEVGEAAEAAAAAAAGGTPVPALPEGVAARSSSGSSTTAGMTAAAGVSTSAAGLKSTVQGMADAAAKAVAEGAAAGAGTKAGSDTGSSGRPGTPPASRASSANNLTALGSGSAARRGSSASGNGTASKEAEPPEFLLQFIAAVVRSQRGRIMGECREHDDVLRLFSSVRVDFWLALAQARKQHKAYKQGSLVMQRL